MVWFFERDDQCVEVETRFDNDTLEFVLKVRWPDGREDAEQRYQDSAGFRRRLVALEQELHATRWRNTGSPLLLPGGWLNKRPHQ